MNGYDLTRAWYNFKFENPDKVKSIHSDMYFYIVDLWNRLGQKQKIGLPTFVTMENMGIGSRNTYYKVIKELNEFGFIEIVSESKNQHQSRVVALSKIEQAHIQALEQAHIQAREQASEQTPEHIDKQLTINKEQRTMSRVKKFSPPTIEEIDNYISEKKLKNISAERFWNFYDSKDWYVGKNKMKNWKSAVSGWASRNNQDNGTSNSNQRGANSNQGYKPAAIDSEKLVQQLTDDLENGDIPGQY